MAAPAPRLNVLSYNIQGKLTSQRECKLRALLKYATRHKFHILCLQETKACMGYVATQVQAIQGATGTPYQVVENPNPANNNKGGTAIINLIPEVVQKKARRRPTQRAVPSSFSLSC